MDCVFCSKFSSESANSDSVQPEWYDTVLARTRSFFLIPGVGAMVPGYTLLISRSHFSSMALLPDQAFRELMRFTRSAVSPISRMFGPLLLFEHGVINRANPSGSCIDHAHWHIMPV